MLRGYLETKLKELEEQLDDFKITICHLEDKTEDLEGKIKVIRKIIEEIQEED